MVTCGSDTCRGKEARSIGGGVGTQSGTYKFVLDPGDLFLDFTQLDEGLS